MTRLTHAARRASRSLLGLVALAAVAAGSATGTAGAWTTIHEWSSNLVEMRASAVSFPSGSDARDALEVVEDRILVNPSECWIEHTWGDSSVSTGNRQNETWFSADSSFSPAVMIPRYNWFTGNVIATDVVYYAASVSSDGWGWLYMNMDKSLMMAYDSNGVLDAGQDNVYRTLQSTALHEYGHVLGLGHEDDEYNIMGEDWTHVQLKRDDVYCYLGEDAADGLVALYGRYSGGTIRDLSVTHFKYVGDDGEYSDHGFCSISRSSAWSIKYWDDAEEMWVLQASPGDELRVEFTYENNGEVSHTIENGFYLSTNDLITTADTLLRTDTMSMSRNSVYTKTESVTLPSSLSPGRYYLGVYVDHDNAISEVSGGGLNTSYHIVEISD